MQEIELRLSVPEVNQILDALGERPFKQVYELVQKIQQQAAAQLQSAPAQPVNGSPVPNHQLE